MREVKKSAEIKKNKKTKTSLLLPPLRNHHTFSFSLFFVLSVAACLSFPISHDHLLALALQFSKITLFRSTGAKYYLNAAMQRWSGTIYQPLWLYTNALNNRMHWCNAGIQGYKSLAVIFVFFCLQRTSGRNCCIICTRVFTKHCRQWPRGKYQTNKHSFI